MTTIARAAARAAGVLLVFSVTLTATLAYTYYLAQPNIKSNEQDVRRKLVAQTLPEASFNNDLLSNQLSLSPDTLLGTDKPSLAWQARLNNVPVAVVLEATAPDGYSGKIELLIGINTDGKLTGVRVVSHKETPGLGDYIETAKSKWIYNFNGKSNSQPDDNGWKVKKDGGQFDYMAGATITPRAVIKAVHHALQYVNKHHATLFANQPGVKA
ncbi:electron transport complex subunit RsxG [Sulfuriferula nivalis]|uniref:Ion-translocating oxidoreductase complex subunit G n=1 Tax=Sulfuriferula nivalis TaxID=2675298 RepID=A0A809RN91_9PROT|nr:electron transport complex subunit RsxG [Sulfuriferula nivalis]BBP00271.1 electron transport complex subunit G [Sulfuriferula nivalis]